MSEFSSDRIKKHKRTWDFICVSNDGKVVHFSTISRKVAVASVFFAVLIIFSSVLSFFYIRQKKELTVLTSRFIGMEAALQDVSRERDGIAAKLALAEGKAEGPVPLMGKKPEVNQDNGRKEEIITPEKTQVPAPQPSMEQNSSLLAVDSFSAKRINSDSVNLRFMLKSKVPDEKTQYKGYIVAASMPSESSPASSWKFPKGINNNNGVPDNPEKGHYYVMKKEKEITVKVKADSSTKTLKIFVFDESKNIMAEGIAQIEGSPPAKPKKEAAKKQTKRRHK